MSLTDKPLPVLGRRKTNPGAVEAALNEINRGARTFTITSFDRVADIARAAEADLEARGVPKGKRDGTILTYRPAGPGKTYRSRKGWTVWTTSLRLCRQNGTWLLENASRGQINADSPEIRRLALPRPALHAVLQKALQGISSADAPANSFEAVDLGGFFCALADSALPETLNGEVSAHGKISAIQVVENLISQNSGPAR